MSAYTCTGTTTPTEIDSLYTFALRHELAPRTLETLGDTGLQGYRITTSHGEFVTVGAAAAAETPGLVAGRHIRVNDDGVDAHDAGLDRGVHEPCRRRHRLDRRERRRSCDAEGGLRQHARRADPLAQVGRDADGGCEHPRLEPGGRGPTTHVKMSATDPADVEADNITLHAIAGSIGTEIDFLETNLDDAISTVGLLDADAALGAYIYETLNDLRVGLVTSHQNNSLKVTDAALVTRNGSILDGANDAAADVVAIRIDLKAGGDGAASASRRTTSRSTRRPRASRPGGSSPRPAAASTSPRRRTSSSCSRRRR